MSTRPLSATTLPRASTRLKMRAHYDVLALAGMALLGLLLLDTPLLLRVPIGVVATLFAPGYVLLAALFPHRSDLDTPARLGLSIGTSVALIPLLALLLDKLPWGIRPWPIMITLACWTVLLSGVALARRAALPPEQAVAMPPLALQRRWQRTPVASRWRLGVACALVLALLIYAGVALLVPPATPVEFYVLGAEGQARDYPREAQASKPISTTVGVVNSDDAARTYSIQVWAVGPLGSDQREMVQRTASFTLDAGARDEQPLTWSMPHAGPDQQLEVLLFVDGQARPFRSLRLWLNVNERNGTK